MKQEDFVNFCELWSDTHEIMANGKVFSNRAMALIFEDLEDYTLPVVVRALSLHRKQAKFAPTANDIIEIIGNHTKLKHIGAEEAWAIALRSFDESLPVVLTNEILAAKAIVQDIFNSGDSIGARMAFKEAYNRILLTAGDVKWFLTQGGDKSLNEHVVAQAVAMGRLPKGSEAKYRIEPPTTTTQKLIEQAHKVTGKVDALAKLSMIKSILDIEENNGIAEREERRLAFEEKRASIIERAMANLEKEIDYA